MPNNTMKLWAYLHRYVLKVLSSLGNNVFKAENGAVGVGLSIKLTLLQIWGVYMGQYVPP